MSGVFLLLINRGKSFIRVPKFTHSFNDSLLSVYYVLSIVVDTEDTVIIKTHRLPVLVEITARRVDRQSITSI